MVSSRMTEGVERHRILFVAEAVTLAHIARANVLARSLDPARFEVHAAWDRRYNSLLGDLPYAFHAIRSLSTNEFLARLTGGRPCTIPEPCAPMSRKTSPQCRALFGRRRGVSVASARWGHARRAGD
jgi:hypothetical protein